jgi:uncharacterized protein (DUF3820 family)
MCSIWSCSAGASIPGRGSPSGKIAGTVSRGRRQIQIDGKIYPASHLVWFGKTGKWPKGKLGYRNGDRLDLRFENLFEATMGELGRDGALLIVAALRAFR